MVEGASGSAEFDAGGIESGASGIEIPAEPVKRKGGRPRGPNYGKRSHRRKPTSPSNAKAQGNKEETSVFGVPEAGQQKRVSKAANLSVQAGVAQLLLLGEGLATGMLGREAALTQMERELITQPALRMAERMPPAVVAQLGSVSDPIMLIVGLGMWAQRLASLRPKKAPQVPTHVEGVPVQNIASTLSEAEKQNGITHLPSDISAIYAASGGV